MSKHLSILIVEDSENDMELIIRQFKRANYDLTYERVETAQQMMAAVEKLSWDLVISDYSLPQFNAPSALAILQKSCLDIPFVVVSGTIGEETAVRIMKAGAQDYIMKDNLSRLVPAVERELKEAKSRAQSKRMEEELIKSEKKYRELYDFLPIPVYEMDFEANVTSVNRAVYETFRASEEDFKKDARAWQLLSPEDIDKSRKNIEQLLKGEPTASTEYHLKRLDGSAFPAIVISSVIYSNDKPVGLRGAIVDITERKRAEESLKESEKKYRLLADNVNDVIFVLDMNLNYTYVSPSIKILRGYEPEELVNQPPTETLTPASMDRAMKILSEIMEFEKSKHIEDGKSRTIELEMRRKDGTTVWTEVKFSFIRDEDHRPVGIMGVTRDITDRQRAEAESKQSFVRMRKALTATVHAISMVVEMKDPYTSGHQQRVSDLARSIAKEMGLSADRQDFVRIAATIHDIGKIAIPSEILSKPTKLSDLEFNLIKTHAQSGYDILKDVEFPWPVADVVLQHHERMDGSGYPQGLKGNDILLEARILAVADIVEAMASHRPYRPAMGIDFTLEELSRDKGIFCDADVVDACLKLFREKSYQLPA
jgi:PAS domain S-box-containing protein/putative nucleotidyltransferase with HDIG domain